MTYLAVAGVVFGVNLLPAFGPPTWAVLVLFRLNTDADVVPLVLVGATSAACGRLVLATAARRVGARLPGHRQARLAGLRERLLRHRARSLLGLSLFVLSPVPSAQLFVAAGLLHVPLLAATAAFFSGRLVSYSGYVTAAHLVERSFGEVATQALRSPWGIAIQVLFTAAVVALPFLPWHGNHRSDEEGEGVGSPS